VWGTLYLFVYTPLAASVPLLYALFSFINLILLRKSLNFPFFRFNQLLLNLLLPFFSVLVLGDLPNGNAIILWALFAPLGALLGGQTRQAVYWFLAYLIVVIVSGILHPNLGSATELPIQTGILVFVLTVVPFSAVVFAILNYFVKQKDLLIDVMQKNRELLD
jgi:hypothetical protein